MNNLQINEQELVKKRERINFLFIKCQESGQNFGTCGELMSLSKEFDNHILASIKAQKPEKVRYL